MPQIMENVWIANLVSTGVVLAVLGFLFKRFVTENDRRHEESEGRIHAAEKEAAEIKENYIKRFEGVHTKIDQTKDEIVHRLNAMNEDRHQTARSMGILETKLTFASDAFKELREEIKGMRRSQ